ncbi:MAG: succinate dehydrogenase/fumarate reductase cytochrome b subunit [Desulfonauticus sp.]|nr:succinate dehydrogenase/fumarate reductase cytochrome b subunit [Desulfonauticus sp.]
MRATNVRKINFSNTVAYLDLSQAITGIFLCLFMLTHTLLVFSIIFGEKCFNKVALFFESTGLAWSSGIFLTIIFLFHFLLTARKIPFSFTEQAKFWSQAKMINHQDTWLWLVQVLTGIVILLFGSIHIWVILNDLPITALKSKHLMQKGGWVYFYVLFLFSVAFHLGLGLYRIGVKWGFITSQNRLKSKKYLFILVGTLIMIDSISLLFFYF